MDAGTVASFIFELLRLTDIPDGGAGPFKATVPVMAVPPGVGFGETLSEARARALTVSTVLWTDVPSPAEIVTGTVFNCGTVVTLKVALEAPAAIGKLAGTMAPV